MGTDVGKTRVYFSLDGDDTLHLFGESKAEIQFNVNQDNRTLGRIKRFLKKLKK